MERTLHHSFSLSVRDISDVVDGDFETRLSFGGGNPQVGEYFQVDMGETYRVEAFAIFSNRRGKGSS